jgi:hypothetical protein
MIFFQTGEFLGKNLSKNNLGAVLATDGVVLAMDGVVLAMDGEVLAPDGEVLDIGWCSTGSRMVKYWPTDGSILVRKCCRKSWEQFWKKMKQTAGCIEG